MKISKETLEELANSDLKAFDAWSKMRSLLPHENKQKQAFVSCYYYPDTDSYRVGIEFAIHAPEWNKS